MTASCIRDRDVGLQVLADPATRPAAGSVVQDQYDLESPWHHHDMHQLQYAFEGSMALEDALGSHLLPRSLAGWIPAGVRHRNSLHRIRSVSLLLTPNLVPDAGNRVRIVRVSPLMRAMMAEAMRWPLAGAQDETGRAFFAALARLCREWIADEAPFSLPSTADPALDAALAFTRTHLAEASIATVCKAAALSERTLRRRCRAEIGMGWDEYRRRARLLAAIGMLTDGRQSIARIAAEVGFESQSAFAKAFRDLTGRTPRAFRREGASPGRAFAGDGGLA